MRSANLVRGFLFMALCLGLAAVLGVKTASVVLNTLATGFFLFLTIVFQPEIRRFLERIGAIRLSSPFAPRLDSKVSFVKEISEAVDFLSEHKIGALIVIEGSTVLNDIEESGIDLKASLTSELLITLFYKGAPTHDGAVLIRGSRIETAACLLPVLSASLSRPRLGARHRAAMGLSESSDAFVIVVSEETGIISSMHEAIMTRFLTKEALESKLFDLYDASFGTIQSIRKSKQRLLSFFK